MRKLIDVKEGPALHTGVFPSLAPNQQALWRTGSNLIFRDGKVEKGNGYLSIWDLDVEESGLQPNDSTGVQILGLAQAHQVSSVLNFKTAPADATYIATRDKLLLMGTYEAGAQVYGVELGTFTPDTERPDLPWCLEPFGDFLLAAREGATPLVWENAFTGTPPDYSDFVITPAIPIPNIRRDSFSLIKKWQNHVLGFYETAFDWSDRSAYDVWDPLPENLVGGLTIRDLDSEIRAAHPLSSAFGFYSADSFGLISFVGAPEVFGAQVTINGIGAVSDSAIVPVGRKHYGLCRKGFFVTDGIDFQYVDGPAVNNYLQDTIDWDKAYTVVGLHYEAITTVLWWYTNLDGARVGLSYNYITNAWCPIEGLNIYAANEQQVFNAPIIGDDLTLGFLGLSPNAKGGQPLYSGGPVDADPRAVNASIQTFLFDGGDRERFKLWDMLRVDIQKSGNLQVRFGFSDVPADGDDTDVIEWSDWQTLEYETQIVRESVYLAFEIRSTELDVTWKLGGFSLHGELTGYL